FQVGSLDGPALTRRRSRELGSMRPGAEVLLRLLAAYPPGDPLHTQLPMQPVPEEDRRGPRVGREIQALCALVVAEEGEAAAVHTFEKHHPVGGPAIG